MVCSRPAWASAAQRRRRRRPRRRGPRGERRAPCRCRRRCARGGRRCGRAPRAAPPLRPSWPGSGPRGAARRASSDTAAATARRAGRPPCRARPAPAGARSTAASVGDVGPGVTAPAHQVGHGADGQVVGDHRLDLVPGERRRDLAARARPGEPGAEHGLVRRVLVEVHEDAAAALLLPPVGGDQVREAALQLAGERDRGGAHLHGVPVRLRAGGTRAGRCCPSSSGSRGGRAPRARRGRAGRRRAPPRSRCRSWGRGRCAARRRGPGRRPGRATGAGRGSRCSRPTRRGRCRRRRGRWRSSRWGWTRWSTAASRARPPGCAFGRRTCRWRRRGSAAAWRAARRRC